MPLLGSISVAGVIDSCHTPPIASVKRKFNTILLTRNPLPL